MEFIYGVIGMMFTICVFALGAYVGWRIREQAYKAQVKIQEEVLTEQQQEELKAEEQAFSALVGYNADVAYGVYNLSSVKEE